MSSTVTTALLGVVVAAAALTAGAAERSAAGDDAGTAAAVARVATPPLGLPPVPVPADNPPTPAKVALGRKLFFDRRLSHNGTMSCAMCHIPEQGFTNNELARPVGIEGRSLRRNSPTLLNVAYVERLFHDGREISLETQVIGPLVERTEMGNPSIGHVIARLRSLPDYDGLFERAFGAGPSPDRIGQAIASYERTLLSARSPFDRWHFAGEAAALGPRAIEGYRLFSGKAGCVGLSHDRAAPRAVLRRRLPRHGYRPRHGRRQPEAADAGGGGAGARRDRSGAAGRRGQRG